MKQRDFSFLTDHFNYEVFELTPEHRLTSYIMQKWKESDAVKLMQEQKIKYACVLKEISSDEILYSFESAEQIDINTILIAYQFYLKQLPSLYLSDVAIFFAALFDAEYLCDNLFEVDENYPSEFAAELLKETYGNVLFYDQFTTLLAACLPAAENTYQGRNEYRLAFNIGKMTKLEKFETMSLPDGANLAKFLKEYTPLHKWDPGWYGFIKHPTHKLAYEFITRTKKYL